MSRTKKEYLDILRTHKGKTFEQIFGVDKAKKIKRKMGKWQLGKTYEQLYGTSKARLLRNKLRKAHLGKSLPPASEDRKKNMSWIMQGNHNTPKVKDHPLWKGDDATKGSIHEWIRHNHGHADHCENPNCLGRSKRFEWSKKDHSSPYTRNINEYQQLCATCHKRYDLKWRNNNE